jgi:hypothetical protein
MALFGILGLVLLVYLLFKLCISDDEDDVKQKETRYYPVTPVFAHELTPGTIVLQSPDGEYFRILHEYNSHHNSAPENRGGSTSVTESGDSGHVRKIEHAHTQTRPSAPEQVDDLLMNIHEPVMIQPPPYTARRTQH